jgi:predicted ATPase
MHLLKRIEVEGFWDTYKFAVDLNPDVTFFIGPNGTGKTTLINLIAAALTADFMTLERLPFRRLTVQLTSDPDGKEPTITVTKSQRKERPLHLFEYRIRGHREGPETKYSLDESEERIILRRSELMSPRYANQYYRRFATGLTATIQALVKVDWLSVHRTPASDRLYDERTYESTVDKRLEAISNDLVRYFNSLSKQKDEEVRKFQEFIFASLLEQPSESEFLDTFSSAKLTEHKHSMTEILKELKVTRVEIADLVEPFFKRVAEVRQRLEDSKELRLSDLHVIISAQRIDAVVERWKQLRDDLGRIFEQRAKFETIINSLLQRKQLQLSESDELVFVSRTKKNLTPQMLSSGEKQLLILLSETLLQRQTPAVFIADEPELSLHVKWQEQLIPSLRELNDRAQIIVATHSPDIVGPLASKIIDMETLIP